MSHFEVISETPMLSHLATKIFSFLGPKDIVNCRLVSKSFDHLIISDPHYWRLQVDEIEQHPEFLKHFPNWKKVLDYFKTRKVSEINCFSKGMRDFLKNGDFVFDPRVASFWEVEVYEEKSKRNEPKNHPIFHAMDQNNVEFFKILLSSPTDFNETAGLWDYNPLIWSTFRHIKNQDFVELILLHKEEKGINLRCAPYEDDGVLYYAIRNKNLKAVKILLKYFMENDLLDDKVLVPPEFFAEICLRSRKDDNLELIKFIIDNSTALKIDFNIQYGGGETLLHLLIGYGNSKSIDYLLSISDGVDFDVNARCNAGYTPYLWACANEGKTASEIFEKYSSVDLKATLSDGRTAFALLSKHK